MDAAKDTFRVVRSLRHLFALLVLSILFEEILRAAKVVDVGAALFPAAVTLAALMVPASTLARDHVVEVEHAVVERVIRAADNTSQTEIEERRTSYGAGMAEFSGTVDQMVRSFAYIIASVPISGLVLVHPHLGLGSWPSRGHAVTLENLLAGVAIALLVVAVWSSYPLTWVMLRRRNLAALAGALSKPLPTAPQTQQGQQSSPGAPTKTDRQMDHLRRRVVGRLSQR